MTLRANDDFISPAYKDIPPEAWSRPDQIRQLVSTLLERDCSALSGRFLHVKDNLEQLLSQLKAIQEKALYRLGLSDLEGEML
jgi:hypothetical protein